MPLTLHTPIILASKSSIRAQMLMHVGIEAEIMPAKVNEKALRETVNNLPIPQQALTLAKAKAESVSKFLTKSIVIGADQICSFGDAILSKPGNSENAKRQLQTLRGATHHQHSAVAIYKNGELLFETVDSAELTMRPLTDDEIDIYLSLDAPLQSCGAYKFESMGAHLFESVKGDADTIMGLPLMPIVAWLHRENMISLSLV